MSRNKWLLSLFALCFFVSRANDSYVFVKSAKKAVDANWTIIGAGPAGIVTIGLLLDLGISGQDITWIDPEFNVGRLGKYYESVPGNTKNKVFISFLESCKTFQEIKTPSMDALLSLDLEKEFPLTTIIEPLRDITKHLSSKVRCVQGMLTGFQFEEDAWEVSISTNDGAPLKSIISEHVVLATGSHPRTGDYQCETTIPLDIALDKQALAQQISSQDSIAVIGSSHSAILILKFLSELKVKRIINFYKNPIIYAVDMGTWVLHGSAGLRGIAAEWAREVLEKNPPANILRLQNTQEHRDAWLSVCNKIIYAIGYERNELPTVNGNPELNYDDKTGIIAPRLFGIGIAFPEKYVDPLGNIEHRIGLNSFMDYAQRMIPQWITKDTRARFSSFEDLFTIDAL